MTVITHPTAAYLTERIEDAQCWVWSLEDDLTWLSETDDDGVPSMGWREFFAGTVTKSGTEDEMQQWAVDECAATLDAARRDLAVLQAQLAWCETCKTHHQPPREPCPEPGTCPACGYHPCLPGCLERGSDEELKDGTAATVRPGGGPR